MLAENKNGAFFFCMKFLYEHMFDNAAAFTGTGTQRHCRPEKGKGRLMDRISYAKQLLCSYLINRSTVDNFRYEMQLINGKLYSCGGSDCEDRIIGLIDAKDRLAARTARARADAARTERGLDSLSDYHRQLLTAFYVVRSRSSADSLASRWHIERSSVYRDKNEALRRFADIVCPPDPAFSAPVHT